MSFVPILTSLVNVPVKPWVPFACTFWVLSEASEASGTYSPQPTFLFLVSSIYIRFAVIGGTCLRIALSPSMGCWPPWWFGKSLCPLLCHGVVLFPILLRSQSHLPSDSWEPRTWPSGLVTTTWEWRPCSPPANNRSAYTSRGGFCGPLGTGGWSTDVADECICECCIPVTKSLCTVMW